MCHVLCLQPRLKHPPDACVKFKRQVAGDKQSTLILSSFCFRYCVHIPCTKRHSSNVKHKNKSATLLSRPTNVNNNINLSMQMDL